MARRLVSLCAIFGLSLVAAATSAQPPGRPENQKVSSDDRDAGHTDGNRRGGRGDGNHGGGHRGQTRWRARDSRYFFFEAVRRDAGPLELMPLLLSPEIRNEIGLDKAFEKKLELYTAEMQDRMDAERRALEANPPVNGREVFKQRLAKENERFEKFLDEMPEERRDRLIGVFVQMRNYRSLSNRLVSENKLGLSREESAKLRKEIDDIREDTMSATRDRLKRIFENGGDRADIDKLFRENQEKIDARIKRKLTDKQLEKLSSLRGREIEPALLRRVEMNPPPLPPPRSENKTDR